VRLVGALRVLHPVPCLIDAVAVVALALVAGADLARALILGVAMLAFQACIGALDDVVDAEADRLVKPAKPIPAGLVRPRLGLALAGLGALVGLGVSASYGPVVLVLGAAGLATGVAYDLLPRSWGIGWVCFIPALPLLIAWTWVASAGDLPPAWPSLFVVAAIAGPMLSLANGLVDREADARTGRSGLAVRLGARRGWLVLVALTVTTYGLAWSSLLVLTGPSVPVAPASLGLAATGLALAGLRESRSRDPRRREAGWLLGAVGLAALGVGWVAAVAGSV
jgi:4-hydroxybenzoate polyprenyltransferase